MSRLKHSISVSGTPYTNFVKYDGLAYVMTGDGLYELDPTDGSATLIRSHGGSGGGHALLEHNGVLITCTDESQDNLIGYDVDAGSAAWSVTVSSPNSDMGMALNPGAGEFYIVNPGDGVFEARDTATGSVNWSATVGPSNCSSQMVRGDGKVFFNDGGSVGAVDVSAQAEDWSASAGSILNRGMTVTDNGYVIAAGSSYSYGYLTSDGTQDFSHYGGCYNAEAVPGGLYWCSGDRQMLLIDTTTGSTETSVSSSQQAETQIALDPGTTTRDAFYGVYSNLSKIDESAANHEWQYSSNAIDSTRWPLMADGNDIWFAGSGVVEVIIDEYPQVAGTVTDASGNAIEGAKITVIDEAKDTVVGTATTASDGTYSITAAVGDTVHVLCEYTDTNGDLHSKSYPYVTPEAPS